MRGRKRMKTEDLLFEMHKFHAQNLEIAEKKNNDYADSEDALSNFRDFGFYGVVVRLNDKFKRLVNIVKKGSYSVEDESIEDTLRDIDNYIPIAYVMLKEEKK